MAFGTAGSENYRKKLAELLGQSALDSSPIASPWQGAARMAHALLYGLESGKQDRDDKEATKWIADMIGGGAGQQASPMPQSGSVASPTSSPDYGSAISSIESGGKYDAMGPVTKSGDRAYGKYQVMGSNIGPWSKAMLGRELTPEQFVSDPQAQDALFKAKFGEYAQKYGPEGAARAWFAGEGGMNDPNRKDQLGTSVADYGRKFASAMGGIPQVPAGGGIASPAPAPQQQMAQAPTGAISTIPQGIQERIRAGLQSSNPQIRAQAMGLAQQFLKPVQPEYVPLGDNAILDKRTGRVSPANIEKKTDDIREYERARSEGYQGNLQQFMIDMKKAGASSVNVSTEKRGQELMVSKAVEGFEKANTAAADATKRIATYGQLASAAQGFTPGATAEMQLQASRLLKDMGWIKGESVAPAEAFKAVQKRLELAATPRGQGQITENERALIRETVPTITTSPEAIPVIIGALERLDRYDMEVARIYRENAQKNGGIPNYLEVSQQIAQLGPPMTDDERLSLMGMKERAGQGAQQPAQAPRIRRYNPATGRIE